MAMITVRRPPRAAAAWIALAAAVIAAAVAADDTPGIEAIAPPAAVPPEPPAVNLSPEVVTPLTVQCGAARASSTGNLLASERTAIPQPRHAGPAARQAKARRIVLGLAAEEARNRDAAIALELYWSLAEAQHSLPEIEAAAGVAELALADRALLDRRGIELPIENAALWQRRLDLDEARILATGTRDALATTLAPLAGLPAGPIATVHPAAGRAAVDLPLDVEPLVAEGLARRPELRMLRAALAHLDGDTVAVARQALALVNPALGGGGGAKACKGIGGRLHRRRQEEEEVAHLRRSLRGLLRDRERAVAAEIRQAARLVAAAAERVTAADRRLAVGEQAAADRRARQRIGDSDAFAVHLADLEAIAARRAVVERLAGWERARTELWRAQGVLAASCCP
jgi:hypothetical protein